MHHNKIKNQYQCVDDKNDHKNGNTMNTYEKTTKNFVK